jgi:hypothetical protein
VDIAEFLTVQLDADELWAREASRRGDNPVPDGGVHWQWVTDDDEVVELDTNTMEYVDEGYRISLRSREEFPTSYGRTLPQFAISAAEEVQIAVGGHIVRHSPARVLADIAAKRRIVEEYHAARENWRHGAGTMGTTEEIARATERRDVLEFAVRLLAAPYADRPGYNDAWRING